MVWTVYEYDKVNNRHFPNLKKSSITVITVILSEISILLLAKSSNVTVTLQHATKSWGNFADFGVLANKSPLSLRRSQQYRYDRPIPASAVKRASSSFLLFLSFRAFFSLILSHDQVHKRDRSPIPQCSEKTDKKEKNNCRWRPQNCTRTRACNCGNW